MNLFSFCQENTALGYVLEHCPESFVPRSASTYSLWSSQLRTPRWIQRRPQCEQHQSWRKPAWLPQTRETRTYRWPPCPLSVSHISSGCWQDGKSDPEVPCGTEATWFTWGSKKRMNLNWARHRNRLRTLSFQQYRAHQLLHLKERWPGVRWEPDCSCHWGENKRGAESHACCRRTSEQEPQALPRAAGLWHG